MRPTVPVARLRFDAEDVVGGNLAEQPVDLAVGKAEPHLDQRAARRLGELRQGARVDHARAARAGLGPARLE